MSIAAAQASLPVANHARARNAALDGVRGLAVTLVFFVHFNALFSNYLPTSSMVAGAVKFMGTVGHIGVDIFFLLSGYLIYGIVLRSSVPYFKFEKRRVQRIYPTFICVFALYLVLSALFPAENKIHGTVLQSALFILANFLFLPGVFAMKAIVTVAWSLSYEFCFYLFLPLFISVARLRTRSTGVRIAILAGLWVLTAVLIPVRLNRMQAFCAGMLLFEVLRVERVRNALRRPAEVVAALLFVAAVAMGHFVFVPTIDLSQSVRAFHLYIYPVMCVFMFVFCAYCFEAKGFLNRFFSNRPVHKLGEMSYSYYLIHGLTLNGLAKVMAKAKIGPTGPVTFALFGLLAFLLCCISAFLLFRMVEFPFSLRSHTPDARQSKIAEQAARQAV